MEIFAIDPGPTQSAWVLYDMETQVIHQHGKECNAFIRERLRAIDALVTEPPLFVCEMVASMGMPVGAEVFATCVEVGRFVEAVGGEMRLITRPDVKKHLCHKCVGVNDWVIRQRLIDLFGPGKEVAIGTKKAPGPLYGIKADEWQALALAIVWAETQAAATAAKEA